MGWLRWQMGRQLSGYDKMFLAGAYWPIKFDCYLLRFKQGSFIKRHTDKVESGRHYRLNIVIKAAGKGGEFVCEQPIYASKRIKLFRPDMHAHEVTEVEEGTRYVFSVGWIRNN
ncbi:2OG-Fe(II) oxygenase [Pseudoalteromonas sp. T1lg22]|uniref:2OG-Fe(II) oxygenase n=1 Tax=Pseudoalteromonas sp. T1lg22 TaxID=2077096 RepID=UPI000CF6562A|nr:2OG-Fe(II) oxygenase [Pseudoalteromonas sp. T1lg22]